MAQKKEPLNDIRTNLITRGFSIAKASLKAGSLIWNKTPGGSPRWLAQAETLIHELGSLKGTAVKVGQTLSMYGEHLLPKEVNDLLKKLQQDAPALAWDSIEKVLRAELGPDKLNQLEVEREAIAAASIGQVHRARIKTSGEELALKIQYPGVDSAVDSDLRLLKFILNLSNLVPRGPRYDQIFSEIREMFLQEIDYHIEVMHTERFRELTVADERFVVPKVYPNYCSRRVIATAYQTGLRADSPEVQALPIERRNRLGRAFLELYLKELVQFRLMQTDPHLGNYLIQLSPDGNDRLVLFDFGAVRDVPEPFLKSYRHLICGGFHGDRDKLIQGGLELGLLRPDDSDELKNKYIDLCLLLTEPFDEKLQPYDWGTSDLPKRVAAQVTKLAFQHHLREPPAELVFLDRKLGGVFIFLSVLKCRMSARDLVENVL